ncbi:MAG: ArsR/SmtB family transcription factor [Planctomycetota bacterium]|jgi:ArsR family transcriptional regulator
MDGAVALFKALSDETRLRILRLLAKGGELCVCDLVAALDITQSKASRHLIYLKHVGLVKDRREGLWSYYSLVRPRDALHRRVIGLLNGTIGREPSFKKDYFRLLKCLKKKACG